jgi:hypothetical protein
MQVTLKRSPWIKTAQFFGYLAPLLMFSAEGRATPIDVGQALQLLSSVFAGAATTGASVSSNFNAQIGATAESFSGSVTASASASVSGRLGDHASAGARIPFDVKLRVNQPDLSELVISYSWALSGAANANHDNITRPVSSIDFVNNTNGSRVQHLQDLSCRGCNRAEAIGDFTTFVIDDPGFGDIVDLVGEAGAAALVDTSFFFLSTTSASASAQSTLAFSITAIAPVAAVAEPPVLGIFGLAVMTCIAVRAFYRGSPSAKRKRWPVATIRTA